MTGGWTLSKPKRRAAGGRARITQGQVDALARALCVEAGHNPDQLRGGGYTIPYDHPVIGDEHWREDDPGSEEPYTEPRSYRFRDYGMTALFVLRVLRDGESR